MDDAQTRPVLLGLLMLLIYINNISTSDTTFERMDLISYLGTIINKLSKASHILGLLR